MKQIRQNKRKDGFYCSDCKKWHDYYKNPPLKRCKMPKKDKITINYSITFGDDE